MNRSNQTNFPDTNSNGSFQYYNNSLLNLYVEQNAELQRARTELKKLTEKLSDFESSYNNNLKNQKELEQQLRETKDDLESAKTNIRQVQNKTLEPLAVFVGMFTFVSVGFNIFSNIQNRSLWIALLFVLGGFIVIFSSLVIHAGSLDSNDKKRRFWTLGLIVTGISLTVFGAFLWLRLPEEAFKTDMDSDTQNIEQSDDDNGRPNQ